MIENININVEPYQVYGQWMKKLIFIIQNKIFDVSESTITQVLHSTSFFNNIGITKITNIDKDLLSLLEHTTESEISLMPYEGMFFNIPYEDENFISPGIILINNEFLKLQINSVRNDLNLSNVETSQEEKDQQSLLYVMINKHSLEYNNISFGINQDIKAIADNFLHKDIKVDRFMIKSIKYYQKICKNLTNMMVNREISYTKVETLSNQKQNEKREKRGKPHKVDTMTIKLTGEHKVYANHFYNIRKENPNAYVVRGHWRHFNSERFKDSFGKKKWIMPFIKNSDKPLPKELKKYIKVKIYRSQ